MTGSDPPIVLVVDDDVDAAETYEAWLSGYDVRRASTGDEALSLLDESSSLVLVDQELRGLSSRGILDGIRDRELDALVVLIADADPGFDAIETGFDEALTRPLSRDRLRETVERLLERVDAADELQAYYSLKASKSTLETEFPDEDLDRSEAYQTLDEQVEKQEDEVDESLGDMESDTDFVGAVREIVDDAEESPESTDDDELTE